jgi:hypothetical protein
LVWKVQDKRSLERWRCRWEGSIKINLKKLIVKMWIEFNISGYAQMVEFCVDSIYNNGKSWPAL